MRPRRKQRTDNATSKEPKEILNWMEIMLETKMDKWSTREAETGKMIRVILQRSSSFIRTNRMSVKSFLYGTGCQISEQLNL